MKRKSDFEGGQNISDHDRSDDDSTLGGEPQEEAPGCRVSARLPSGGASRGAALKRKLEDDIVSPSRSCVVGSGVGSAGCVVDPHGQRIQNIVVSEILGGGVCVWCVGGVCVWGGVGWGGSKCTREKKSDAA